MIHKTSVWETILKILCAIFFTHTQLCMNVATGKKQMVTAKYASVQCYY